MLTKLTCPVSGFQHVSRETIAVTPALVIGWAHAFLICGLAEQAERIAGD
jgi:hypothetical protein